MSRRLSQRTSRYIGVSEGSKWGPKAQGLDIEALRTFSPVITTCLDFGEIAVPSATALAATPLNFTVTPIDVGIAANSIVANSNNGYLLITPGSTAASGYSIQGVKSNVVLVDQSQYATLNTGISASRNIYFGIRAAISCTTAWDGAIFFGIAASDTGLMTPATGALDSIANSIGIHIGATGVINLSKMRGSVEATDTLTQTAATLAHTSSSFRARDFHDYFIWIRYTTSTLGATANNVVQCYVDGALAAELVNVTLPAISTAHYNTIEVLNGAANQTTMAISHMVTGVIRPHVV